MFLCLQVVIAIFRYISGSLKTEKLLQQQIPKNQKELIKNYQFKNIEQIERYFLKLTMLEIDSIR